MSTISKFDDGDTRPESRYPPLRAPEFWNGSVGALLRERAFRDPDRKFFKCSAGWRTFAEIDGVTDRLTAGLGALGLEKGDRLVVISANRDELVEVLLACAKTGVVEVPLNIYLKGSFLTYQIEDSDARAAVLDAAGWESLKPILSETRIRHIIALDPLIDVPADITISNYTNLAAFAGPVPTIEIGPGDLISILYTSGTTGMPKGCMLPHGYYRYAPFQYLVDGKFVPGERVITAYPFFHTSAQVYVLMLGLAAPIELVLLKSFSASTFIATARAEGATTALGVSAMAMAILKQPEHTNDGQSGSLRQLFFPPLTFEVQLELERRFNLRARGNGFGQTECMPICHMTDAHGRRSGCGKVVDNLELAIIDEDGNPVRPGSVGEIAVRPRWAHMMYKGYWRKPDATLKEMDGYWHHTGDLGRVDEDGFVYFVDRKQQSMRRRGENVSSIELEIAIRKHPDIEDVAVHAVPSELSEDDIKAVIVARNGHGLTPPVLFAFFAESLPYFAVPRYVEFRDSLPVNAMGRVMKHVLKAEGITPTCWDFEAMGFTIEKSKRR